MSSVLFVSYIPIFCNCLLVAGLVELAKKKKKDFHKCANATSGGDSGVMQTGLKNKTKKPIMLKCQNAIIEILMYNNIFPCIAMSMLDFTGNKKESHLEVSLRDGFSASLLNRGW